MKYCQTPRSVHNHKADCAILRQEKRSQSLCGNSHSEKYETKLALQTHLMGCRWTTHSYGRLAVLLDGRAGDNSFPLLLGGLSNVRLVGNWASANYWQCCKTRSCCSLATALHSEGPEQLECNWHRGPVVQPLEVSQKRSKQAVSIKCSPEGLPWLRMALSIPGFTFRTQLRTLMLLSRKQSIPGHVTPKTIQSIASLLVFRAGLGRFRSISYPWT